MSVRPLVLALFLAILLAVGGLNARYLFRTELYEHGDLAANSLLIRDAKRFRLLHGQYSRWGFYHPGPGWFYAAAAGEALFYDTLRVVPTPWNGQLLAVLLLQAGFLAAAVGVVARAVPGQVAAPLAVLFAGMHIAALGPDTLLNGWPPLLTVPAMGCFLVAAASVAAGRGRDLPLAALAGAALLHAYIAEPLWVFPIAALAYAGLLWALARPRADSPGGPRRWRWPRPWQAFPAAHRWTAVIVFLCALPVVLDALRGVDSNLAAILAFRREHAGERPRKWLTAVSYVLRFLTYKATGTGEPAYRGGAAWAEVIRYVRGHAGILTVWTLALLSPGAAFLARSGKNRDDDGGGERTPPSTGRFLGALALLIVLAGAVAVHWGRTQEGTLFYFTSWSNFGVLLALALLAAAALGDVTASRFPRAARSRVLATTLWTLAACAIAVHAERFRSNWGDSEASRNIPRSVDSALAADGVAGHGQIKYLAGPADVWEDTAAVALALERRGEPWRVAPGDAVVFGRAHAPAGGPLAGLRSPDDLRVWHIVPPSPDPAAPPARRPLFHGSDLRTVSPDVDPAAGATMTFSGPRPNASDYFLLGWSSPNPGDPYTWTERKEGLMVFRPVPAPAGRAVEMVVDLFPALTPGRVDAQRLALELNGRPLGTFTRSADRPLRVGIPAAEWNARPEAWLVWSFPDAVSPAQLGQNNDTREIAFGFRAVTFGLLAP